MMITDQLKGLENTKSNLSKKCFYLLEVSLRKNNIVFSKYMNPKIVMLKFTLQPGGQSDMV